jgi:peptide/nickel transport system substrate-binding protein
MKKHLHLMIGVFLIALMVLPLSAARAEKTIYTSQNPNEMGVTTLNPLKVELAHDAMRLIYDRLIEWAGDGEFYGGLLDSWEISEDGLTWELYLKKGVKFHDGSVFNAQMLPWFFEEMTKGPSAYMVGAVDKIEVVDDYHARMHLKHPEPNMLFNMSQSFMAIPSKEAVEKYGEDFGIKAAIGSGPYILESWSPGDKLVLKKNPDYTWGPSFLKNKGPAVIDRVVYRDIKDESTRFLELKTGKLDVLISVPTMFIDKIEKDPKTRMVRLPGNTLYHLVMNTQSAPLDNRLVRKGIALAVDQESITKNVFANAGQPAHTYLIDSLPESKVPEEFKIKKDLKAANAALDEAGYKMGPDGVRIDADGKPLNLKLWAKNESSYRRVAEVLQAQLAQVGVQTEITLLDPSTIRNEFKKGEHQLAVRSYNWENADILEWFFNSKRMGYPNAAFWHDNESDYLMQKAMTRSRTQKERIANFKEYHQYLLEQYVWAPIYLPDLLFAVGDRVVLPAKIQDRQLMGIELLDYDLK